MQQKAAFPREDKHKPAAIASLRPVWKVFLDVIPRRVRPFGAEGGLTRIGWGWVGARSNCDSLLEACLLLLAVSEAKGQNRTQRGTGSSRPFGASLMLAQNEIYGATLPTHLLEGRNIETGSTTFDLIILCPSSNLGDIRKGDITLLSSRSELTMSVAQSRYSNSEFQNQNRK